MLMGFAVGCQPPPPPSPELAYCEELFAIVERYLLPIGGRGQQHDRQADFALALCHRGSLAEGVAILEDKPQRARWPLPQRQ